MKSHLADRDNTITKLRLENRALKDLVHTDNVTHLESQLCASPVKSSHTDYAKAAATENSGCYDPGRSIPPAAMDDFLWHGHNATVSLQAWESPKWSRGPLNGWLLHTSRVSTHAPMEVCW